ncbi:chaperone protein ClpB1-like protein [Tanacetum coccineum]
MLDVNTFTHLTCDTLVAALEIAKATGNAEFTRLHVAAASISFPNSMLKKAISNVDDVETSNRAESVFHAAIKKLPSQSTILDCVSVGVDVLLTLRWAQKLQRKIGDTHLAIDHLMLGLLQVSEIVGLLREAKVSVSRLKTEVEQLRGRDFKVHSAFGDDKIGKFRWLKTYGRDLVEQASKLDPVIGREEEIKRVIEILSRKTKNGVVLIGERGVGKTAVIEGLAQKISRGDVLSKLADARIVALDMGALIAGTTRLLNEHPNRRSRWEHARLRKKNQAEVANLFKLMLDRGKIRCVCATTLEEHRKCIEKDAAFERLFQQVLVAEPSVTDTINILRGLQKKYEDHHKVLIHDGALVAAVELSSRYISGMIHFQCFEN